MQPASGMSDAISDRTSDLMCLSDVHRWGVIKTARPQSVAEHCFHTMVIAGEILARLTQMQVADMASDYLPLAVMYWAMCHDAPEVLTGDIDGKFKRDNPVLRKAIVDAEEAAFPWYGLIAHHTPPKAIAIVKLADKIEGLAWIRVWGIGPRADDVSRELDWIITNEIVPAVALVLEVEPAMVAEITRQILNHSVSESNCIQMRRHRAEPVA